MSAPGQVVERFLSIALGQEFDRLPEVMDDAFVLVEPDSLPYGGAYSGPDGYARFFSALTATFEITAFDVETMIGDHERVVVKSEVGFRARGTARALTLPVVELFTLSGGKLVRSEVYVQDTAALLDLIDG